MNPNAEIPEVDNPMPNNAVRLYGDAMDDFPVLKAFQQYIDAEQAKARKRLLSLGIFFGILTGAIIAVFVLLLLNVSQRNQELNDRLVEYAMKDRSQQSARYHRDAHGDESDFQGDPGTVDDPAEDVAAKLVRAEDMSLAGRLIGIKEVHLIVGVRGDLIREYCGKNQNTQDKQSEHCESGLHQALKSLPRETVAFFFLLFHVSVPPLMYTAT